MFCQSVSSSSTDQFCWFMMWTESRCGLCTCSWSAHLEETLGVIFRVQEAVGPGSVGKLSASDIIPPAQDSDRASVLCTETLLHVRNTSHPSAAFVSVSVRRSMWSMWGMWSMWSMWSIRTLYGTMTLCSFKKLLLLQVWLTFNCFCF